MTAWNSRARSSLSSLIISSRLILSGLFISGDGAGHGLQTAESAERRGKSTRAGGRRSGRLPRRSLTRCGRPLIDLHEETDGRRAPPPVHPEAPVSLTGRCAGRGGTGRGG